METIKLCNIHQHNEELSPTARGEMQIAVQSVLIGAVLNPREYSQYRRTS
jgi:hypothetical protein